ncbi:MAG: glycoside hydrolase family 15 protein [archaeon]
MPVNKSKAEAIYRKSIDVLTEVQLRNGGCLASPKGERYPYVYPRDHAICILGFISAGMYKEARKALEFILQGQLRHGAFPQRYDTKGHDASYKPIQIDGTGLIIYTFVQYVKATGDMQFAGREWNHIKRGARYIAGSIHGTGLVYTPNSIHEFPPMEEGLEVWANAVCCAALGEAASLCKEMHRPTDNMERVSEGIRSGILKYLWNSRLKCFIKNIRLNESSSVEPYVDACEIALADYGVFADDDPKIKGTAADITRALWNRDLGGICRYPKYEGRNNGGWGPWPHFTLMMCRHFIRLGDKRSADRYLSWVLKISCKGELPEHIATIDEFEEYVSDFRDAGLLRKDRLVMINNARKHPMFKKGIAYITLPLAWPHAEFIRTWNLYRETFS